MSVWPAAKARRVLAALQRIGWTIKRESGSHRVLARSGWPDFVLASTTARRSAAAADAPWSDAVGAEVGWRPLAAE